MQFIVEFLTAAVIWIAAMVLAQFGVEVDLDHKPPARVERVVETAAKPDARPVSRDCPEQAAKARAGRLAAV